MQTRISKSFPFLTSNSAKHNTGFQEDLPESDFQISGAVLARCDHPPAQQTEASSHLSLYGLNCSWNSTKWHTCCRKKWRDDSLKSFWSLLSFRDCDFRVCGYATFTWRMQVPQTWQKSNNKLINVMWCEDSDPQILKYHELRGDLGALLGINFWIVLLILALFLQNWKSGCYLWIYCKPVKVFWQRLRAVAFHIWT